jgi:hypothetical protein
MNVAHYAPDDRPLAAEEPQTVAMDGLADMKLPLRASVRLVSSRWPLESIRAFCENDGDKKATMDVGGEGVRLLVFRPVLAVEVMSLALDEYSFFAALAAEKPLGAAIIGTIEDFPAFDFSAVLQRHIKLGTFRSLKN